MHKARGTEMSGKQGHTSLVRNIYTIIQNYSQYKDRKRGGLGFESDKRLQNQRLSQRLAESLFQLAKMFVKNFGWQEPAEFCLGWPKLHLCALRAQRSGRNFRLEPLKFRVLSVPPVNFFTVMHRAVFYLRDINQFGDWLVCVTWRRGSRVIFSVL